MGPSLGLEYYISALTHIIIWMPSFYVYMSKMYLSNVTVFNVSILGDFTHLWFFPRLLHL